MNRLILILTIISLLFVSLVFAETIDKRIENFYEKGKYEKALIECQELLRSKPNYSFGYVHLGYCYQMLGDYGKAFKAYNKAISLDPKSALAHAYLASLYIDIEKYEQAISECKSSIELRPSDSFAYFTLGQAYYRTERYNLAIENLEKSINLDSKRDDPRYYFALALFSKKEYEKTRTVLQELIKSFPKSKYIPDAKYLMGSANFREGKFFEAIDCYDDIIGNHPDYNYLDYALFWKGNAYYRIKQYDNASNVLKELVERYPNSRLIKSAHHLLATAYAREGMIEKCLEELRKSKMAFLATSIFVILILLIVILFIIFVICVYALGKMIKKRKTMSTEEKPLYIFRIGEVIFITVVLLSLPMLLSLMVGKIGYGKFIIGFLPFPESQEVVYVISISSIISNFILASLILTLILKRYHLTKESIGLIFKNLKSITILPLIATVILYLFNLAYEYTVTKILHLDLPEPFLSIAIRSIKSFNQGLLLFLCVVVIAPIAEEIIFRVFYYNAFKRYTNVALGISSSALFFALYHFQLAYLIPLFFVGLVLAYMYERTKTIIPCMATHILNNFLFFVLVYFFSSNRY